ncbi:hypothetical protein [uncultured Thiodictyon sp.]|uniref:hypothetical protein n=1 Tax=uncultured Thiodictyon sp. TaxID=1846217 RepID=UPI0025DB3157|nr:hypothetical protein [uncultured Thiodictyon sp.]
MNTKTPLFLNAPDGGLIAVAHIVRVSTVENGTAVAKLTDGSRVELAESEFNRLRLNNEQPRVPYLTRDFRT